MKKLILIVLILATCIAGAQWVMGKLREAEMQDKLLQQIPNITGDNHKEIKARIVEEAAKLNIEMSAEDITITIAGTDEKTFDQRAVQKIVTVENQRATITATYQQPILFFIPLTHRIESSAIIKGEPTMRTRALPPE